MEARVPGSASSRVGVALRLPARMLVPGGTARGVVDLVAPAEGARVAAVTLAARMLRRNGGRDGAAVTEESVDLVGPLTLATDLALDPGARRSFDFGLSVPAALASSIPNQLDYELVACADDVREAVRCLVLPARAGTLPTMPVAPPWAEVGAACEVERDDGTWSPAVIAEVQGQSARVAWSDGAPERWVDLHQLREV